MLAKIGRKITLFQGCLLTLFLLARPCLGQGVNTALSFEAVPVNLSLKNRMLTSWTIGDFNGDLIPDVIFGIVDLTHMGSGTGTNGVDTDGVLIMASGDGSGQLKDFQESSLGNAFDVHLLSADFNGDGKQDLYLQSVPFFLNTWFGRGDGTFSPVHSDPDNGSDVSALVDDFNGDHSPDIIGFVTSLNDFYHPNLTFFQNDGKGDFVSSVIAPFGEREAPLAEGDLNGDGKPDVVSSASHLISFLNDGNGTFERLDGPKVGAVPYMVLNDFNGDHKLDIVLSYGRENYISVFLGNGDGTFTFQANYEIGGTELHTGPFAIMADMNGDGVSDLIVSINVAIKKHTEIYLGKGDGTYFPAQIVDVTGFLTLADFNRDGKPDLLARTTDTITILLNRYVSTSTISGDLNGDGSVTIPDALLALQLAIGDKSATSTQQIAGDLNVNGKLDIGDAVLILQKTVGLPGIVLTPSSTELPRQENS